MIMANAEIHVHQVMQGVRRSWLACTRLAADPPMSERELNAYATLGARAARAALVDLQLTGCGGGIGGSSSVNTANAGGGGASGSVVGVLAERSLAAELRDTCVSGEEGAMGSMVVVQDSDGHGHAGMSMSHRPLVDQSCRLMMSDLMRSRLTTSSSLLSFSSDSSAEILGECYPPLACPEEDSGNAVREEVPFLLQLPLPSGAAGRSQRAPHTLPTADGRGEGGQAAREGESGGQLALAPGREPRVLNSSLAGSSFAFVSSAGAGSSASSAAFFSTTSSSYTTGSYSNEGNFNSVSQSVGGGARLSSIVGSKSAESSCSGAHQVKPTAAADNVD
jgi:hypothetical protein